VPGSGGCAAAVDAVRLTTLPLDYLVQFLAIDATHVYFIQASQLGAGNDALARIPLCGGPEEILVKGVSNGLAVAVGATDVYWLDSGPGYPGHGSVSRFPKTGGTPETLVPNLAAAWPLALDDAYLYWESAGQAGGMKRMSLDGGPVENIGGAYGYVNVALDDTYLYWTEFLTIGRSLKTGGGDQNLAMMPQDSSSYSPWCTAVDDTNVYVTTYIGPLFSVPKNGGTPTKIAPTARYRCLAVDKDYLYVASDDDGVLRIRKDGSSTDVIGSGVAGGATEIAVDDSNVFWGSGDGLWRWSKR
jgi:hypothetical protein